MGNQVLRMLLGVAAAAFACAASEGLEWTAQGLQMYQAGRFAQAETMYRHALEAFDRAGEAGSLDRALTLENIAVTLRAQARYTESEKLHREALPQLEALTGPASLVTAPACRLSRSLLRCGSVGIASVCARFARRRPSTTSAR